MFLSQSVNFPSSDIPTSSSDTVLIMKPQLNDTYNMLYPLTLESDGCTERPYSLPFSI